MKIKFESKFEKDLRNIKDKKLLSKIKEVILECKAVQTFNELKNIKKMQGYQTFYRLKIGDYRVGIEIVNDELIFVRLLHRKDIYRFFP
jgi:mRNA interferase RelE/StbE